MKSNKFEFHEQKLSKKNKPINNQRQKPQTHDSKQKKPKEKERKKPRNSRPDQEKKEDSKEKQWFLYLHSCPNQAENQSQSYSKEFRPEQRSRKKVLRGEAGSGRTAQSRRERKRAD
jgi:hypothetical protein